MSEFNVHDQILFMKYMAFISWIEGTDFTGQLGAPWLTAEDIFNLTTISQVAQSYYNTDTHKYEFPDES